MAVRVLKMLLFATSLAVALAACASNRGPATPVPAEAPTVSPAPTPQIVPTGPITLTYWEEDNDAADVLLDELAAAFTVANPGIAIQRVHYTYNDLRNQFRAESLFAGEPPDLVRAPGEFTGPFGELRIVRAMDELFSADYLADYLPGALAGATLRGKVWGLPDNFGGHLMLIYNKALVSQAPADTDSWIAQLKTLTDPVAGQWGLVFDTTESYWLVPWLAGFGGWPLDAQDQPALDTAEMVESLWFLHDLVYEHRVTPARVDYAAAFDLFGQAKAAYVIDGAWNLEQYTGLGIDLGIAVLPRVSQTSIPPAPMATGRYWFIAAGVGGPKLDAAARFVEFMTSAQVQAEWVTKMRRLPSHKDVLGIDTIVADPILGPAADQLRLARGVPPALEMVCAWRGLDSAFRKVMADDLSADDAPPAMQAEAALCVAEMSPDATPTPVPAP